ncbi:DUF4870 domain-containing protein [Chloroflexota bacterium]
MSDNNDLLDRLSTAPPETENYDTEAEATPIPVLIDDVMNDIDPRDTAEEALRRAAEEERQGRDIIREYEDKYYGRGETAQQRTKADELASKSGVREKLRKLDWKPKVYPASGLDKDERLWSGLAHLSFLLTLGAGFATGFLPLVLMFAPLVIYFGFRDKSRFVTFNALQSFALQLLMIVGWPVVFVVGSLIYGMAMLVAGVASIVLIGIPFLLLFTALYLVFVGGMLLLPLAMIVLSIMGGYHNYNGKDFRYPFIANWIERQTSGGIQTV